NLRNQLARDLLNESNESNVADILALHDQNRFVYLPSTPTAMDPVERAYVERLHERYQTQLAEIRAAADGVVNGGTAEEEAEIDPVYEEREVRAEVQGEVVESYYYYQ